MHKFGELEKNIIISLKKIKQSNIMENDIAMKIVNTVVDLAIGEVKKSFYLYRQANNIK